MRRRWSWAPRPGVPGGPLVQRAGARQIQDMPAGEPVAAVRAYKGQPAGHRLPRGMPRWILPPRRSPAPCSAVQHAARDPADRRRRADRGAGPVDGRHRRRGSDGRSPRWRVRGGAPGGGVLVLTGQRLLSLGMPADADGSYTIELSRVDGQPATIAMLADPTAPVAPAVAAALGLARAPRDRRRWPRWSSAPRRPAAGGGPAAGGLSIPVGARRCRWTRSWPTGGCRRRR